MMYHGINGRNIESVMKEYKHFPNKLLKIQVSINDNIIFCQVILQPAD